MKKLPRQAPVLRKRTIRTQVPGTTERLQYEIGQVEEWTREMISAEILAITIDEVKAQEDAGNPPTSILTDKMTTRSPLDVERRIDVEFGKAGLRAIMAIIEHEVSNAIAKTTREHSGNLARGWTWTREGEGGNNDPDILGYGEQMRYAPFGDAARYAALANIAVNKRGGGAPGPGSTRRPGYGEDAAILYAPTVVVRRSVGRSRSRRARSRGFMATAINRVRSRSEAVGWWIRVEGMKV